MTTQTRQHLKLIREALKKAETHDQNNAAYDPDISYLVRIAESKQIKSTYAAARKWLREVAKKE